MIGLKCTSKSCSKEENYFMLSVSLSKCDLFCTFRSWTISFLKVGFTSHVSLFEKSPKWLKYCFFLLLALVNWKGTDLSLWPLACICFEVGKETFLFLAASLMPVCVVERLVWWWWSDFVVIHRYCHKRAVIFHIVLETPSLGISNSYLNNICKNNGYH